MSLNGNIRINTSFTNTKDNVDLSTPSESVSEAISRNISATSGILYHDQYTLSASEVYSIDLNDGSLQDVYGQSVMMSGVTSLYIKADATNTVDLVVSGGAGAFLNDQPALSPSEGIGWITDIDVQTDSKLYIVNGVAEGIVDIVVTGN